MSRGQHAAISCLTFWLVNTAKQDLDYGQWGSSSAAVRLLCFKASNQWLVSSKSLPCPCWINPALGSHFLPLPPQWPIINSKKTNYFEILWWMGQLTVKRNIQNKCNYHGQTCDIWEQCTHNIVLSFFRPQYCSHGQKLSVCKYY